MRSHPLEAASLASGDDLSTDEAPIDEPVAESPPEVSSGWQSRPVDADDLRQSMEDHLRGAAQHRAAGLSRATEVAVESVHCQTEAATPESGSAPALPAEPSGAAGVTAEPSADTVAVQLSRAAGLGAEPSAQTVAEDLSEADQAEPQEEASAVSVAEEAGLLCSSETPSKESAPSGKEQGSQAAEVLQQPRQQAVSRSAEQSLSTAGLLQQATMPAEVSFLAESPERSHEDLRPSGSLPAERLHVLSALKSNYPPQATTFSMEAVMRQPVPGQEDARGGVEGRLGGAAAAGSAEPAAAQVSASAAAQQPQPAAEPASMAQDVLGLERPPDAQAQGLLQAAGTLPAKLSDASQEPADGSLAGPAWDAPAHQGSNAGGSALCQLLPPAPLGGDAPPAAPVASPKRTLSSMAAAPSPKRQALERLRSTTLAKQLASPRLSTAGDCDIADCGDEVGTAPSCQVHTSMPLTLVPGTLWQCQSM